MPSAWWEFRWASEESSTWTCLPCVGTRMQTWPWKNVVQEQKRAARTNNWAMQTSCHFNTAKLNQSTPKRPCLSLAGKLQHLGWKEMNLLKQSPLQKILKELSNEQRSRNIMYLGVRPIQRWGRVLASLERHFRTPGQCSKRVTSRVNNVKRTEDTRWGWGHFLVVKGDYKRLIYSCQRASPTPSWSPHRITLKTKRTSVPLNEY